MACFTHEEDDQRFSEALIERLAEFAPEVEPSKTALLRFGSYAKRQCVKLGVKRSPTFDFSGFTHYVTESRSKRFMVGRKTQGSRISRKLKEVGVRLARRRPSGGRAMMDYAKRHLQIIVNDSSWEPDGVTLQVRFCEGGKLYRVTGRFAATLPFYIPAPPY